MGSTCSFCKITGKLSSEEMLLPPQEIRQDPQEILINNSPIFEEKILMNTIDDQVQTGPIISPQNPSLDQLYSERVDQDISNPGLFNDESKLIDLICDDLCGPRNIELLIQATPLDQIVLDSISLNDIWQNRSTILSLKICRNFIERIHFDEPDYPMRYKGIKVVAKVFAFLTYFHLEKGINALIESEVVCQDSALCTNALTTTLLVQSILVYLEKNTRPVWWVKSYQIDCVDSLKLQEDSSVIKQYTYDVEQQLIKCRGYMQREISNNHTLMQQRSMISTQKQSMFKYKPLITQIKLQKIWNSGSMIESRQQVSEKIINNQFEDNIPES